MDMLVAGFVCGYKYGSVVSARDMPFLFFTCHPCNNSGFGPAGNPSGKECFYFDIKSFHLVMKLDRLYVIC